MSGPRFRAWDPAVVMPNGKRRVDTPPTPRELQVLAAIARGDGGKEVAYALGISYQTVKNHMARLCAHTGASNAVGVLYALGWVKIPDEAAA